MKPSLPASALPLIVAAALASGPVAADDSPAKALVEQSRAAMRNDPEQSRALAEQALGELARQPDPDLEMLAQIQLCDYFSERDRGIAEQHVKSGQALVPRITRPALAPQLLDRLLHHAVVIQIEGSSYRLRQHADLIPENVRSKAFINPPIPAQPPRRRGRPPKNGASDHATG